jgi:hypothetical protein
MPTVICQKCGTTLRFEGLAGLCPKCGTLVRVKSDAPASPAKSPAAAAPPARKGRQSLPDLDSLNLEASGEVYEPPASEVHHHGPFFGLDPRLVKGGIAAIVVLVLFGLYVLLRPPSSSVSVAPLPRPVVAPPPVQNDDTPPPPPPPAPPVVVSNLAPTTVPVKAASRPAWMTAVASVPKLKELPITDKLVEQAIKKSVGFLKRQLAAEDEYTKPNLDNDRSAGKYALAVYALLQAGLAVDDSELSSSDPYMQGLLQTLRQFHMSGDFATYDRSLRANAYAVFDRAVDHQQLLADRDYLLKTALGGAYTYHMPPSDVTADTLLWDNSNAQYGVLGVWAGVLAGSAAPDRYWNEVEHHWLACQNTDGGWPYAARGASLLTMTAAGVTTLCVTSEQLELIASKGKKDARPKMSKAINDGIDFMGQGDRLMQPFDHAGYLLYGIERAALATGYRWFGNHDWYRELGAREIKQQGQDGTFGGLDEPVPETAFRVLFLARGRQPVLMNKLRFDGAWNNRPRDVAKLTQFSSAQLEKPFAWGVADLSRNWWDWLESPILMITTDTAPDFSDENCAKLRSYTDAGGFIFFHNEYGSSDVDAFVKTLVKKLYPEYPMVRAAPDDPVYTCDFPIKKKTELYTVSNGARVCFAYSPKDITQDWVRYRPKDTRENSSLQLGINLFVMAAGKSDFRNRLNSPYEPPNDFDPTATIPVLQVMYPGNWNPEPKAYERFGRWFQNQTSLKLDVQPTALLNLHPQSAPLAVMSGNQAVDFSKMDFHALQDFVQQGGILFIDAAGGNKDFANSVRQSFLPAAFPSANPTAIPFSDPILAGNGPCMDPLPKAHLRNYASILLNGVVPAVQYAAVGKGAIIVSDLDVTTGLLNSGTYGILGYTPAYCQSLMKNVVLWSVSRYSK